MACSLLLFVRVDIHLFHHALEVEWLKYRGLQNRGKAISCNNLSTACFEMVPVCKLRSEMRFWKSVNCRWHKIKRGIHTTEYARDNSTFKYESLKNTVILASCKINTEEAWEQAKNKLAQRKGLRGFLSCLYKLELIKDTGFKRLWSYMWIRNWWIWQ
jgi:hypothetical protein